VTGSVPDTPGARGAIEGLPANETRLSGEMIAKDALRYTPAGIPILDARLMHRCELTQAGHRRAARAMRKCPATRPAHRGDRISGYSAQALEIAGVERDPLRTAFRGIGRSGLARTEIELTGV
jgi:primosomal replication protein N